MSIPDDEPEGIAPHTADDWDRILQRRPVDLPAVGRNVTDDVRKKYAAHALSVGPFVTDDVKRIDGILQRIESANKHAPLAGRRALLINGPYHYGKSSAVLVNTLTRTAAIEQKSPSQRADRLVPWIYTELSASGQGRALVAAMLQFIGAPVPARAAMPDLVRTLRLLAGPIGLRGVIIDDLGSASKDSGGPANPGGMANALKSLVMQVPATFVLIGTDLAAKPMFSVTRPVAPAQQVLRRSTWLELKPWSAPTEKVGPWHRLLATISDHLRFPRAGQLQIMNLAGLRAVHNLAEGRPGTAIELVQHAAASAILANRLLDIAMLERTARDLRGNRP